MDSKKIELCLSTLSTLKVSQSKFSRGEKKGHGIDCLRLCNMCMCFEVQLKHASKQTLRLESTQVDSVFETITAVNRFVELYGRRSRSRGMTSPSYLKNYLEELASAEILIEAASKALGIGSKAKLKRKHLIEVLYTYIRR
jgi:hypothetical protein